LYRPKTATKPCTFPLRIVESLPSEGGGAFVDFDSKVFPIPAAQFFRFLCLEKESAAARNVFHLNISFTAA
jgi:hypothetical protein